MKIRASLNPAHSWPPSRTWTGSWPFPAAARFAWYGNTRPGFCIHLVDAGSGATRDLDSDCPVNTSSRVPPRYPRLAASPDLLFYDIGTAIGGDLADRIRVSTVSGDSSYWLPGGREDFGPLAVSGDGRFLAYTRGRLVDSLVVRDLQTGLDAFARSHGLPLSFSPDGRRLVYEISEGYPQVVDLDAGTDAAAGFTTNTSSRTTLSYGWSGSLLQVIYSRPAPGGASGRQLVLETAGGSPRVLADVTGLLPALPSWSPDGTRVSWWQQELICDGFFGTCRPGFSTLFVMALPDGAPAAVATAMATRHSAFLADSRTIVHVSEGRLYRVDLP